MESNQIESNRIESKRTEVNVNQWILFASHINIILNTIRVF